MMLSTLTKHPLAMGLIQVALIAWVVISMLRLSEAKTAMGDAYENREACERLSAEIKSLRKMETVAQDDDSDEPISNSSLVQLASECGMSSDSITLINALTPIPIQDSDYQSQDVSIQLESVTVEQLVKLALRIERGKHGAKVTSIQLTGQRTANHGKNLGKTAADERWNARLILTQLLFTARSASR